MGIPADPYDYSAFTKKLAGMKSVEMLLCLDEEIERAQRLVEVRHNLVSEIARQTYLRKLSRLVLFIKRQELPPDLTPVERKAFSLVAESLVKHGELPNRVWLSIAAKA